MRHKYIYEKIIPSYYTKSKYNLRLGKSTIPNAGFGVFTEDLIIEGSFIDEYFGDLYHSKYGGTYFFEISDNLGIDAFKFPRCYMAMINDASWNKNKKTFDESKNNCVFVVDKDAERVFVLAKKDILPKQELFISYGEQYWNS